MIFNRTIKLGNLSLSYFLIAFTNVSSPSLEATANHSCCKYRSSWPTISPFDKFSYPSKIEGVSIFPLNVSEHKTYIVKTNDLAALQLELLRRCVIS